jgi:hypothetical protein
VAGEAAMNNGDSSANRPSTWWARRHIARFSSADRSRNSLTSTPAEKNASLADRITATAASASATSPTHRSSSSRKAAS